MEVQVRDLPSALKFKAFRDLEFFFAYSRLTNLSALRIRHADSPQASQRCPNSGAFSTHSEIGKRGRLKSGCLHGIEGSSPPACINPVAGRTVIRS